MSRSKALAVAWTVVIFVLCWLPRHQMPVHEGAPGFLRLIHFDKWVHAGLFAGFAFFWQFASAGRATLLVGLVGLILAPVTEIGQGMSWVNRDPDLWDGLADCAGVLLGLAAFRLIGADRTRSRKESERDPVEK